MIVCFLMYACPQFDLGCQQWKRTLVGTVHNLGLVFSFVLCGFISDRSDYLLIHYLLFSAPR